MKARDEIAARRSELERRAEEMGLDAVVIAAPANVKAFCGVDCDSAVLELRERRGGGWDAALYTDFRYAPMVHRLFPRLETKDIARFRPRGSRLGYEGSVAHSRFLKWEQSSPDGEFVDFSEAIAETRAVKTSDEITRIRAAEKLACEIWRDASARFRAGMTEREMARTIQRMMVERGDGEAFETIVCIGANAAECHHVPDDTVWNGRESVLVDMGVRLGGVASDLTRNLFPRPSRLYRQVYDLVLEANLAAIAAAKPGVAGRELDRVARKVLERGGFGRAFGHSLGHGVGYEIHEAPYASKKSKSVLKPGMTVTIEPGVYLEGNLGVRIEDLVLITETGCEVLSSYADK